jgi:hypothetical protein
MFLIKVNFINEAAKNLTARASAGQCRKLSFVQGPGIGRKAINYTDPVNNSTSFKVWVQIVFCGPV